MKFLAEIPFHTSQQLMRRPLAAALSNHHGQRLCTLGRCYRSVFSRLYSDLRRKAPLNDGRARLSGLWAPTGGIAESSAEDSHAKLIRAGFLRQAHSGIFHMLPLGRRVQDKLEALIDKYMAKLNASKLSLSSISSEELWARSGRLSGVGSELFRFKDRKNYGYLLSPTHEEEITTLVSSTTSSYKDLPVRVYQISRKYRDERRPRQGLLRSREFTMKDLYTFDCSPAHALDTYYEVREIYARLFDELKIPYLVADADSGTMGGKLSHEFHFPTAQGEDHVISCSNCDYVANEELAECAMDVGVDKLDESPATATISPVSTTSQVWHGISKDRRTLINVCYPSTDAAMVPLFADDVNVHAVKSIVPEFDASIEDPLSVWIKHASQPPTGSHTLLESDQLRILNLFDFRIAGRYKAWIEKSTEPHESESQPLTQPFWSNTFGITTQKVDVELLHQDSITGKGFNLIRVRDGDSCSRCSEGKLKVQKAIELGHTFHLGTRYSDPLEAMVTVPANFLDNEATLDSSARQASGKSRKVAMQMGCHGIGVSRIIGAVADTLADEKGLNWPRVMAPFEVLVIPAEGLGEGALQVYDALANAQISNEPLLDLALDDRRASFPRKMKDADLVGYPILVVVGRGWKEKMCEVQCRRLQVKEEVPVGDLPTFVRSLLEKL